MQHSKITDKKSLDGCRQNDSPRKEIRNIAKDISQVLPEAAWHEILGCLDVTSVACFSFASKPLYKMVWTSEFLKEHKSITGHDYYRRCWRLLTSPWHTDIHSHFCEAAAWKKPIKERHMEHLDKVIAKYGTRFCQFYVEDMLLQLSQVSIQEQEDLVEIHQYFRALFSGWLLEDALSGELDECSRELMDLDLFQISYRSWVEYTPLPKLPVEAFVQIMSRLD